jgi:hypothetical protein
VVSGVLRWAGENLTFMVLEHTSVGLADDPLLNIGRRASLCEERYFEKHAAGKVDTLQELEVDVHVEWKLALSLKTLLLWGNLVVSLDHDTLSEELLLTTTAADLLESSLCFVNQTSSKGAETNLDKSSVEENLTVDVEGVDGFLQMGHKHHITGLIVVVVKSEEVNLAKHSSGSDNAFAVDEKVVAENVDECSSI